ncbi:MAG: hypothetical protein KAJ06_12160 [Gammaproteobacteria bacterium]|nr:hypothetical protein [Gammaproteobacteria bacterium]
MAIVFDMSSGKIQSENTGVSRITEHFDLPENDPALQEVSETSEKDIAYLEHIRELLRKL